MGDAAEAACRFVNDKMEVIVDVANTLTAKRELTGDEVVAIVNSGRIVPI
jgi:hypothetical protein